MNTITYHQLPVQPTAIACNSLEAFLSQLAVTPVMMCILTHTHETPIGWVQEQAIHLTALTTQRLICFATIPATSVRLNEVGRLSMTYPLQKEEDIGHHNGSLLTSIAEELINHLQMLISTDPRVFSITQDCRYTLPSDVIWSVRTRVPFHYHNGQWHPTHH